MHCVRHLRSLIQTEFIQVLERSPKAQTETETLLSLPVERNGNQKLKLKPKFPGALFFSSFSFSIFFFFFLKAEFLPPYNAFPASFLFLLRSFRTF
jgi:hypothetical protein